jgi:hypothetical protein
VGHDRRRGSIQPVRATAQRSGLVAVSAALALAVVSGCAYPSGTQPACADAILEDWTTGALEPTYPADCYDAAIDALPEDLRAYTTAADDISRVAVEANREAPTRQLASASQPETNVRAFPAEIALLAALLAVLAVTGLGAALVRRRRPR